MQRRLFYTSPVDHHNLEHWADLGRSLSRAVATIGDSELSVEVGTRPIFGYGSDSEEATAAVEEQRLAPRQVRIDLWCSICFYATVCLTLGPGVSRRERRALRRRLRKKELAAETFLRQHEGPYDLDSGCSYGYSLDPGDDRDRSTIADLLAPFDPPLYLGERWLLQDRSEQIDTDSFDLVVSHRLSPIGGTSGPDLGIFLALDSAAEERIWQACTAGEGLIACYPDDPAEEQLLRRFSDFEDLRIFLAEAPSAGMRVTIGRCHQDDSLVVVHGPPYAPELDEPPVFVI